jgi:hypothetical protein
LASRRFTLPACFDHSWASPTATQVGALSDAVGRGRVGELPILGALGKTTFEVTPTMHFDTYGVDGRRVDSRLRRPRLA